MYALDANQAKAADTTSSRIDDKGSYTGIFTRAQHVTAKNTGTKGIDFDFEADDGRRARFTIYTIKADGTQLRGYKTLMALMTCLKLRNLAAPKDTEATTWDYETKQEVTNLVPQFVELLDKHIGVMISMEEYEKSEQAGGGTAWRPALQFVFQADTGLMASEILNRQTEPKQAAVTENALKNRPLPNGGQNRPQRNSENPAPNIMDDPDIPF